MGKGDKKSRKGKITMGSYGKSRPHNVKKAAPAAISSEKAEQPAAAAKPEKTKKSSA